MKLNIWLNESYPKDTLHSLQSVFEAIKNKRETIDTTNIFFCNMRYMELGYRIFVHMLDGECIEITLGTANKHTNRNITMFSNIEQLLLGNEFGHAVDI